MGRTARHLETFAGFDDPLDTLLGCHRRIEKQLVELKRLRQRVDERGVDAEASVAAGQLLAYFDRAASHHHDDEEVDLFPLLAQRITDLDELGRFEAFRATLATDQRELDAAWGRLRRALQGIADGLRRRVVAQDVDDFAAAYAGHIVAEECALREYFDRWLDAADRELLARAMAERRRADRRT